MPFDHDGPVPLYKQLADDIRGKCTIGEYQTNHRIPSVQKLMSEHGLSDTTVRKAIRLLVEEGVLFTVPGLGIFCA